MSEPVRTPISLSVLANLLTNRAGALSAGLLHEGAIVSDLPDGWLVTSTFEIGTHAMPDGATLRAEHEAGVSVLGTIESIVERVWAVDDSLSNIPPIARYRLVRAYVVYVVEDQHDHDERIFVLPYETLRPPGKPPAPEALYRAGRHLDWKAEEVLVEDTLVPDEPAPPAPRACLWWIGRVGVSYEVFVHGASSIEGLKTEDPVLARRYYRGLTGPFASHAEVEADLSARVPPVTATWVTPKPDEPALLALADVQASLAEVREVPVVSVTHVDGAPAMPSPRRVQGRPFGQSISTRPTRVAVELMGNPDNGGASDAATIDVIALLMREGWEYHDIMRVLEEMDRTVTVPEGEDHSAFAIRTFLMGDDTATKSSTSRWPKDAPTPPVPPDDIPF